MNKLILIFLGMLITNISVAACDSQTKYNINVNIKKINFIYDKKSREIPHVNNQGDSKYVLGTYDNYSTIDVNWNKEYDTSEKCVKVKEMNINLILNSNIYVANEILPYKCTFNRTTQHELTHFKNKQNAYSYGVEYLKNNLDKVFSLKYTYKDTPLDLDKYIESQLKILQNNVFKVIEDNSYIYDSVMDTEENYRKESLLCSSEEREMINQEINYR